jgi:hypothetical protein
LFPVSKIDRLESAQGVVLDVERASAGRSLKTTSGLSVACKATLFFIKGLGAIVEWRTSLIAAVSASRKLGNSDL